LLQKLADSLIGSITIIFSFSVFSSVVGGDAGNTYTRQQVLL